MNRDELLSKLAMELAEWPRHTSLGGMQKAEHDQQEGLLCAT